MPANETTTQSIPFQFVDLFGVGEAGNKLRIFSVTFLGLFVIRIYFILNLKSQ